MAGSGAAGVEYSPRTVEVFANVVQRQAGGGGNLSQRLASDEVSPSDFTGGRRPAAAFAHDPQHLPIGQASADLTDPPLNRPGRAVHQGRGFPGRHATADRLLDQQLVGPVQPFGSFQNPIRPLPLC